LSLAPLTEARRELLEIPPDISGVIVLSIDDESVLLGLGLRPGDVIESINQRPVTSPAEVTLRLNEALTSTQQNVLVLINRNGTNRYLAMPLDHTRVGATTVDASAQSSATTRHYERMQWRKHFVLLTSLGHSRWSRSTDLPWDLRRWSQSTILLAVRRSAACGLRPMSVPRKHSGWRGQ
jgi:membrane-associated protease RseP (regulator of RpoE activity)